jgi:hypothetical protein
MFTRAQKRDMDEGDLLLWGMIVDNDDICFEHILPKLNQNDIKFLYDVNSETRALIKRSPCVDELEEKFKVEQMSSISTLEFAWNNMHWGTTTSLGRYELVMDQAWFCWQVADTNKLELLKWVREEKNCEWDRNTISTAAYFGNLEMLEYCLTRECPGVDSCCAGAAHGGQLECLKHLHEVVQAPWDDDGQTALNAVDSHSLHILEYLVDRKYEFNDANACSLAAQYGDLDCLKYLHETAKAPWDGRAVRQAHNHKKPECLQYLLDKNCPLPEGWRYEDGIVLTPRSLEKFISEGNLIMVQYCVAKGFPVNHLSCATAAGDGQLEILQYLHEEVGAPWDWEAAYHAAQYGHLHILEYLFERKYNEFDIDTYCGAAASGHLDCLKYLHETVKAPWDAEVVREAHEKKQPECLQYLLDNNCPLPEGWRYEHGTLIMS